MIEAKGLRKYTGLMFRTKYTSPLIFKFDEPTQLPIHSWFVFFPFTAIWYLNDEEVDRKIVTPFKLSITSQSPFTKLIEIPINGNL